MSNTQYVLDVDSLIEEHLLKTGKVPDVAAIKMLAFIVDVSQTAYYQGVRGGSFMIGYGIPIKSIEQ